MPLTQQERTLLLGAFGDPELTRSIADLIDASGSGDVAGPASATDNAIVRFDATTGKILQNSVITVADTTGIMQWAATLDAQIKGGSSVTTNIAGGAAQLYGGDYNLGSGTGAGGSIALLAGTAFGGSGAGGTIQIIAGSAVGGPSGDISITAGTGTTNGSVLFSTDSGSQTILALTAEGAAEFTQITTPANPSSGNTSLYFKSDDKLYSLTDAGLETEIGAGGGDVTGPASSLNSTIALFDGLTGKLLKDSTISAFEDNVTTATLVLGTPTSGGIGYYSTAVGFLAGGWHSNGNASFGTNSLYSETAGLGTVSAAFGFEAGGGVSGGTGNSFFGSYAGNDVSDKLVAGSYNTFLGTRSGTPGSGTFSYSIALGAGSRITASHQWVVGGDAASTGDANISDAYFGSGVTDATPTSISVNATGGFGTNINGAAFRLAGGKGTGSANPGNIIFATSTAAGSSATLQTLTDRMTIDGTGAVNVLSGLVNLHTGGAFLSADSGGITALTAGDDGAGNGGGVTITAGTADQGGIASLIGGVSTDNGNQGGFAIVAGADHPGNGTGGSVVIGSGASVGGQSGDVELSIAVGATQGSILMNGGDVVLGAGVHFELTSTVDPGAPTDSIRMATKETTAGTPAHTLHLRTEAPVEAGIAVASTNKARVWINGVEYYILLTAV